MKKIIAVMLVAVSLGGCYSNKGLLNSLANERKAAESLEKEVFRGCVAPIEGSKYAGNIFAVMTVLQICQNQAIGRAIESVKLSDSPDKAFMRSCFLTYFDLIGVPGTKEQKEDALAFCERKLAEKDTVK